MNLNKDNLTLAIILLLAGILLTIFLFVYFTTSSVHLNKMLNKQLIINLKQYHSKPNGVTTLGSKLNHPVDAGGDDEDEEYLTNGMI